MATKSDFSVIDTGTHWRVSPLNQSAKQYIDREIGRMRMRYGCLNIAYIADTNLPEINELARMLELNGMQVHLNTPE